MCANKKAQTQLTLGDLLAPRCSTPPGNAHRDVQADTHTHTPTHTHPPTHFKTIKQTFFFVLTPLDLQKAQLLFKSRRCMNSEKRKTSTKITFKTLQPHNAAGQRGGGSWLATYNKRLHILWTSKKLLKNATKFGQPKWQKIKEKVA